MSYHEWKRLAEGQHGENVKRLQQLLASGNRWGEHFRPGATDGLFGPQTGDAVQRAKWFLGYPTDRITRQAGQQLRSYLVARGYQAFHALPDDYAKRKRARRGKAYEGSFSGTPYPFPHREHLIGLPYQGTHDHQSSGDPLHNWESCNAVDIAAPVGTPILAVEAGEVTTQWGSLDSNDPHLLGLRMHVRTAGNEWYYAHASRLIARPGSHVRAGQQIAVSGSANGVAHLHLARKHGDPGKFIGMPTPGYHDRGYPN